ncbi:ATP-grasp domain-containing protein [Candidatus Woesearchaeota archaeon]|nr:ATP-grasp domain-containing protein [Candidatus Woesearchaeota archaeon]
MKVGVIYNGFYGKDPTPEERELRAMGTSAAVALEKLGHEATLYDMDNPADIERLATADIEAAFYACERIGADPLGEAYVSAYLELLGIPHTSVRSSVLILATHKPLIKMLCAHHSLPTPAFQVFRSADEPLDPKLRFPLIVKGAITENSIGMDDTSVVLDEKELRKRLARTITELRQEALVEEFIDGREFNVAIIGGEPPEVLPISEIVFEGLPLRKRVCNYLAKWDEGSVEYQKTVPRCPPDLTAEEERIVTDAAVRCYRMLGCEGHARVDIRYRDGVPYILEINPNPGIAETGCGFVRSANAHGLSYPAMIGRLLENALLKGRDAR